MALPDRFTPELLERPPTRGLDVVTKLRHFSLITYAVDPARVRPHVNERFDLDTQIDEYGQERVWVSVVPFQDADFQFSAFPWPRFTFGQTNYRTYVIDRQTGQRAVWFFGTTLGAWLVYIPRLAWSLPWHPAQFHFETSYADGRYTHYEVRTKSDWAGADVILEDSGQPVELLNGYSDLEAGLVKLTHPTMGVFYRLDGRLGTYSIWHDRLRCTRGRVVSARFELLDRLGLVPFAEQGTADSVLIQPETTFIIKLPPKRLR